MKNTKAIVILFASISVGIFALLFTSLTIKTGFPQISQAQVLPTPTPDIDVPFVCYDCTFGTNFGNRLAGKNLKKAYIIHLVTEANNYKNTNFRNAILDRLQSNSDNFTGVNFTNASIQNSLLAQSNFTNANFTGANLNLSALNFSDFTEANFTNANLLANSGQDDSISIFTNAIWANTTCPDGTNSDNDGNTCIGHLIGQ